MSALYFDSSSLVKRYSREIGTNWVFSLVRASAKNRLYLARITGVEVIAALTKRMRVGSLGAAAAAKAINRFEREFSNRYLLIEISPQVIQKAMDLAKAHTLRGYDAVQLASAIQANQDRISIGGRCLQNKSEPFTHRRFFLRRQIRQQMLKIKFER
ncbi:MAG: type II toxin-antitoxin system VapC family toxin [Pyrinomonadaceae bacterium]